MVTSSWIKSILKTAALADRIGFLAMNYGKKIMERLKKDHPDSSPEAMNKVLGMLSEADPTRNGAENNDRGKYKYLEWLTRMFINGDLRMAPDLSSFEDIEKARTAATTHYINKARLGSIMDYTDTAELLKLSQKPQSEFDLARQQQKARSKGAQVEYDDGHTKVLKVEYNGNAKVFSKDLLDTDPELKAAAQAVQILGEGTSWCTKAQETAANYIVDGPFYVIYENGEKVAQLHPASKQLMDIYDNPISFKEQDDLEQVVGELDSGSGESTQLAENTKAWVSSKLRGSGAAGIVMNADLEERLLTKDEAKLVGTSSKEVLDYISGHQKLKKDPQWKNWALNAVKTPDDARRYILDVDSKDKSMMKLMATDPDSMSRYIERIRFNPSYHESGSLGDVQEFVDGNPQVRADLLNMLDELDPKDHSRIIGITKVLKQDNPKAREALKHANTWALQDYMQTFNVFDSDLIKTAMSLQADTSWIADLAIHMKTPLPAEVEDKVLEDGEKNNFALVSKYRTFFGFPHDKHSHDYNKALSGNDLYKDPMDEPSIYHRGFFEGGQKRNPQVESWLIENALDHRYTKYWEKYLSSIGTTWPEGLKHYLEISKNSPSNKGHFSDLFDPAVFNQYTKNSPRNPYTNKHPMSRLNLTSPEKRLIPGPDGHVDPLAPAASVQPQGSMASIKGWLRMLS